MDVDALINAGSGLAGAFIGASATLLGGRAQHSREVESARKREVLARAEDAAKRLGVLFAEIENETLAGHADRPFTPTAEHATRYDRERSLFNEAHAQSQFLAGELRERMELYIKLLRIADAMGSDGYVRTHYDSVGAIILNTERNASRDLADFLADRPLQPLDPRIDEYMIAKELFEEEQRDTHPDEDDRYTRDQADWRERHLIRDHEG